MGALTLLDTIIPDIRLLAGDPRKYGSSVVLIERSVRCRQIDLPVGKSFLEITSAQELGERAADDEGVDDYVVIHIGVHRGNAMIMVFANSRHDVATSAFGINNGEPVAFESVYLSNGDALYLDIPPTWSGAVADALFLRATGLH